MNKPPKDYTHTSWMAAAALLVLLVAMSFIPPHTVGGIELRRANILSDLVDFDDRTTPAAEPALYDEEEFRIDMNEVAERIEADTVQREVQRLFAWEIAGDEPVAGPVAPDTVRLHPTLVPIEDYDTTGLAGMRAFCDTLLLAVRPVRIAVLGDSFIEGDILTADLRERLQTVYGGGGPGFAPMASPLTAFRRTVRTQSKGWTAYNIMQRRAAPAHLRDHFYVSGWVCQPAAGASTRWEMTDYRDQLDSCTAARIFFLSPHDSRLELILNDTLRRTFDVSGDASVRQIAVESPRLHALEFRVLSGTEGFIGYGAVFESGGVVVDNYSVRSNNGQAMFWTNPSVNAQIHAMLRYDLIILQYGLNIMQSGVHGYSGYGRQIEKMVTFVRECFPGAAVLVLGVSDRSVKTDAGFVTMDAIPSMLSCQREAARHTGAAFWPTAEAMRSLGGMERFVANGWAGKDFTHINYAGGRRVAWSLVDAINAGAAEAYAARELELRRGEESQPLIDTVQQRKIDRQLLHQALSNPVNTLRQ